MPIRRDQKMLIGEVRKLAKLLPPMLERLGFVPVEPGNGLPHQWRHPETCWGCPLNVTAIHIFDGEGADQGDGWPWLACRYHRDYDKSKSWEGQVLFKDIREALGDNVNQYSGKNNCHVYSRMTAADALAMFEHHLKNAI